MFVCVYIIQIICLFVKVGEKRKILKKSTMLEPKNLEPHSKT